MLDEYRPAFLEFDVLEPVVTSAVVEYAPNTISMAECVCCRHIANANNRICPAG